MNYFSLKNDFFFYFLNKFHTIQTQSQLKRLPYHANKSGTSQHNLIFLTEPVMCHCRPLNTFWPG